MTKNFKFLLSIATIVVVVGVLTWAFLEGRAEMEREQERERPVKTPERVFREASGEVVLKFDKAAQERIGLKTETLQPIQLRQETTAYGRLEADPAQTFVVRAPFAGQLVQHGDVPWPSLGNSIEEGAVVADLDIRIVPMDRVGLQGQLAQARADVEIIKASLKASRAAYERDRKLNAEDRSVSEKAVQAAEAKVKGEEAQLVGAEQKVRQLDAVLSGNGTSSSAKTLPLSAALSGEVVEVLAQPGEVVESGQPLFRIARFDRVLARVYLAAGEQVDPNSSARVSVLGHDDRLLDAERVALGSSITPATQGQEFVFAISEAGFPLRPGMAVSAYLPQTGELQSGVTVSRSAVVRYGGKAWVFVRVDDERFQRREINVEKPIKEGYFVSQGLDAGDAVVTQGAQSLLSEEFRFQIQVGEEAEGR